MKTPNESTLKKLFARCRNLCAFPSCATRIVDPQFGTLAGRICHIKARSPRGPRYDPKQSEEERHSYENLIVLCGVHHGLIDDQPETFTTELLLEMKEMHERQGDIELSQEGARLARLLIADFLSTIDRPNVTQTIIGNHNVMVAGDQNIYQHPPKVRVVVPRREGAISVAQCRTVQKWIETLAENTTRMAREQAFAMWWVRFKKRFGLNRYEELETAQFDEAKRWYQQQRAILTRGLKNKVPDAWRNARYATIKQAMKAIGVSNDMYYPQVTQRLKLRRAFTSLTQLTNRDLDRVYAMALRDAQNAA